LGAGHGTKILAEFEFGGHSPLDAHPLKNVVLGYDVVKISAGCLVYCCVHIIVVFDLELYYYRICVNTCKRVCLTSFNPVNILTDLVRKPKSY